MESTITITETKCDLLADAIHERLQTAARGHCARVDYLVQEEAISICERLRSLMATSQITAHVLGSSKDDRSGMFITADEAIELRNRKETILCLFVPPDMVDATFSSLANSFEAIDGRELYTSVLNRLLKNLSHDAERLVRAVFSCVRTSPRADSAQRLDFAIRVNQLATHGDINNAGRELWRVGLIPDAAPNFDAQLDKNRHSVLALSRPKKLQATPGERIQELGVDSSTSIKLTTFFRTRSINDVVSWSRELLDVPELTFDHWKFPQQEQSDLRSVTVTPFLNKDGQVEKYCKLKRPDGSSGALLAEYGPNGTLVVRWKTDPLRPRNLHRWRVEIVPSGGEAEDMTVDLPTREVPGKRGEVPREEVTLKLDFELGEGEAIDYAVCVRVTPLDIGKNEILDKEDRVIFGESEEFFLVAAGASPTENTAREKRATVPNIAFGRLEHLLSSRDDMIEEGSPQWASKGLDYFSLKLNKRKTLTIGLSPLLLQLERDVLRESRSGGCYVARVDEVASLSPDSVQAFSLQQSSSDAWQSFWSARDLFFGRLRKNAPRDVIEVADWTAELADTAIRYAQSYRRLLDDLIGRNAPRDESASALGVDSVLIQIADGVSAGEEQAVVVLPTHPLRAGWVASYTQLLKKWEEGIIARGKQYRSRACDLDMLRLVTPGNVPAFVIHPAAAQSFAFFENLRFFHGIALPAQTADPQRRLDDIATILAVDSDQIAAADIPSERLAEHLVHFLDVHPYAHPLTTVLVNPDRGELFADAVDHVFQQRTVSQEEENEGTTKLPPLQVTAYVEQPERNGVQALERIRRLQTELQPTAATDAFLPALSVTLRDIAELRAAPVVDAHLALVADLTHPTVTTTAPEPETASTIGSFALYGLITRFISSTDIHASEFVWRHRILPEAAGRGEQHPVAPRFTDTLLDLHTSLLTAQGRLLNGAKQERPALEVTLTHEHQRLLADLHARTNWVISLDRYFALEYYDSPRTSALQALSQAYVLDYTPDFTEGLGHRLMVTTTWQEEISQVLGRAMEELGFRAVESSVRQVLGYLKTISGHLAMQVMSSSTKAAEAVGLGVVIAWLAQQGRLKDVVLIPVDPHPELFTLSGTTTSRGERRCDVVLVKLRRGIVEATFVEVKWRRGSVPLDDLAPNMYDQMKGTAQTVETRFFDDTRIDGALQRASLASVLRFYFERAKRYGHFDVSAENAFVEQLSRLEKRELTFRPFYEGYIVSLERDAHKPILFQDAKITVLTVQDFEASIGFHPGSPSAALDDMTQQGADRMQEVVFSGADEYAEGIVQPQDVGTLDHEEHEEQKAAEDTKQLGTRDIASSIGAEDSAVDIDTREIIIALGEAHGVPVEWRPSTAGSPHLFITGIPGQGKSWTTTRLVIELGRQHVPSLVMDFHGQFSDSNGPYAQTIHPTIIDAATGLPFSPFEFSSDTGSASWRENSYALAEIFGYVAGLGDIQQDVIYTAIRDAYKARGLDQPGIPPNENLPTMEEVLSNLERQEASRHTANVLARCRPLLEMDLFRPTSGSEDLLTQVRRGLVIDLHNVSIEAMQLAVGAFVLRKIYKDMFRWGQTDRLRLAIVLDEAHRLTKDTTLPKIMKEGRKFGIAIIVASQGLGDFNPDIPANAGAKVIFRTNYPESRKIAGFIGARQGQDLATRIEHLPVGVAYVQTPEMPYGAQVKMYPPEK